MSEDLIDPDGWLEPMTKQRQAHLHEVRAQLEKALRSQRDTLLVDAVERMRRET